MANVRSQPVAAEVADGHAPSYLCLGYSSTPPLDHSSLRWVGSGCNTPDSLAGRVGSVWRCTLTTQAYSALVITGMELIGIWVEAGGESPHPRRQPALLLIPEAARAVTPGNLLKRTAAKVVTRSANCEPPIACCGVRPGCLCKVADSEQFASLLQVHEAAVLPLEGHLDHRARTVPGDDEGRFAR